MAKNFPGTPNVGDYQRVGTDYYRWNGTTWLRQNITDRINVVEYNDSTISTANTITIDSTKYNYHKHMLVAGNNNISFPADASPYTEIMVELNGDALRSFNLSTIVAGTHTNTTATLDTVISSTFFRPDGLKMYIAGATGDTVIQYGLTTAWDIRTATSEGSVSTATQETGTASGLYFKPDGTRMYIVAPTNDNIYQYNLSTPWVVSTAVVDPNLLSVSATDTTGRSMAFRPDGTVVYYIGNQRSILRSYTMSTPWDVSTGTLNAEQFDFTTISPNPYGMAMSQDGKRMFITGSTNDTIVELTMSTPWDITTLAVTGETFSLASPTAYEINGAGLYVSPDGFNLYVSSPTNDRVYRFEMYRAADLATVTVNWDANIYWDNNQIPAAPTNIKNRHLYHFVTYDGVNWVGRNILNNIAAV